MRTDAVCVPSPSMLRNQDSSADLHLKCEPVCLHICLNLRANFNGSFQELSPSRRAINKACLYLEFASTETGCMYYAENPAKSAHMQDKYQSFSPLHKHTRNTTQNPGWKRLHFSQSAVKFSNAETCQLSRLFRLKSENGKRMRKGKRNP
jgi:hypothetical protein